MAKDNDIPPQAEIQALQRKVEELSRQLKELTHQQKAFSRSERLLQALNQTSLAIAKAETPSAIFETVADELEKLNFSCIIFSINEALTHITIQHLNYKPQAVKTASDRIGLNLSTETIRIEGVSSFTMPAHDKITCWSSDAEGLLAFLIPDPNKHLAKQVTEVLQIPAYINAPLIVRDKVIGILSVQSDDLLEEDIPTITAFANQLAAAWHKAELYEQAQIELEERLRAEEIINLQSTALESAASGVLIANFNGEIIWGNQAITRMSGYQPEEYIGELPTLFSSGLHDSDFYMVISETLAAGRVWRGELINSHKDGSTYTTEQTIIPIFNTGGTPTHYISIQQDISEDKHSQLALAQRAAQLELLNDIGGRISALLDPESLMERAVELVHKRFDYQHVALFTVDQNQGEVVMAARAGELKDLFHPDHRLQISQGVVGWAVRNNETVLVNKVEDDPRYVNLYPGVVLTQSELSVPVRIGSEVIGAIDVQSTRPSAFDDSDVMVMETLADQIAIAIENARLHNAAQQEIVERKLIESELRKSEARYRTLSAATFEGIALSDRGTIVDTNQQLTDMLGYAPNEIIGQHVENFVFPPDRDFVAEKIKFGAVEPYEHRAVCKNGKVITVEVQPQTIGLESLTMRVTAIRDITERKRIEDALRNIAAGVSALTGVSFFQNLARYLSETLSMRYAFAGELIAPGCVQTIAFSATGEITDNFVFDVVNTPAHDIIEQNYYCCQHAVKELFPKDSELAQMQVESYAGISLHDSTGAVTGILVVMDDKPIDNPDLTEQLLQIFAVRVSTELERLKVGAEVERRVSQISAINQLGQMVTSSLDIQQVLEQVILVVPPLVNAEGVSILLKERTNELTFAAASGDGAANLPGMRIPADTGVAGKVLSTGQSIFIGRRADQHQVYRDIEEDSGYHTRALLAVPLLLAGEVIGVMEAVHQEPAAFSEDDLQILETASAWVSIAIGNARKLEAIERRLRETQALATINHALTETMDLDRLLVIIVDSIKGVVPAISQAVIHLTQSEGDDLVPVAISGSANRKEPYLKKETGQGIAGQVLQQGLPINIRDTQDDSRFVSGNQVAHLRSLLVVPIQSGGQRLGTISVSCPEPEAFTQEDQHLLTIIGVQTALAIESARLFVETQQRAEHLELLNEITRSTLQQPDLNTILQALVQRIQKVFASDGCYITLWDEVNQKTNPVAAVGPLSAHFYEIDTNVHESTFTSLVLNAGHAMVISDLPNSGLADQTLAAQIQNKTALALPLIAGSQRLGAVLITYREDHRFTSEEIELGESIAQQTALSISKAQLLDAEQQRRREAETLREISNALTATLEIDLVLERILLRLERAIPHDSAAVLLLEDDKLRIVAAQGLENFDLPVDQHFPASVTLFADIVQSRQPIVIQDIRSDERWQDLDTGVPIRSWMAIPLIIQEEVVGVLTIDSWEPAIYSEQHIGLAQAFSTQASIALQNARLYAAARRRLAEAHLLYQINNLIVASVELDVDAILTQVVELLWHEFNYYHVHVYLFDQESGALIANQGSGQIGEQLKSIGHKFSVDEGIVGYVATVGEAFFSNNVADVHFFIPNPLLPETTSETAAPLRTRDEILGVLDIHQKAPDVFDEDEFRFLVTIADQLAVVLDKALLYTQLQAALEKEQNTRAQLVQTEKLAAMGRLIASVAHELNNPLQAVQNALYLVKMEENLSTQAGEDLQVAIDEGTRMAGLIAQLRDTYRPTVATDFHLESVPILIDEVRKLIGTHLRHNQVFLSFTPDPDLPKILMIRDQIKQVILNLCINGVESMPDGGDLTIRTEYHPDNDKLNIAISDTGPGLSPEIQSRIFEPFFTTKEGGTGLGLAVSYEIIQNHGGSISVSSDPGSGATFTIVLPRTRDMLE